MSSGSLNQQASPSPNLRQNDSTFGSKASHYCNSTELSDVKFVFVQEGKVIHAHKFVLAVCSPVLQKMLYSNKQLGLNESLEVMMDSLRSHRIDHTAFLNFLEILYMNETGPEVFRDRDISVLQGIWLCAHHYEAFNIKQNVLTHFESLLTLENVICTLESVLSPGEDDLYLAAFEYIDRNFVSLIESENTKCPKAETIQKILERDTLDAPEDVILEFALEWAESECERRKLQPSFKNKRKVLGPALFEIRFTALSTTSLSEVLSSGLFTPSECKQMFLQFHSEKSTGIIGSVAYNMLVPLEFKSARRTPRQ